MAHNAGASLRSGIQDDKLSAVWEFRTSPHFDDRERAAIEFAIAAASQPNAVTDDMFALVREHWSDGAIVEITALIAYFGFMNRFNDTLATPLEDEAIHEAETHIATHGWSVGKHRP